MTETAEILVEELQQHLQEEVKDLNSNRSGNGKWVYALPIDYGPADYPRIHIQNIGGQHNPESISSNRRRINGRIQITIFNHVDGKFDIHGNGEERSKRVLGWLAKRVINEINQNQDKWRSTVDCSIYKFTTLNDGEHNTERDDVIGWRVEAAPLMREQKLA